MTVPSTAASLNLASCHDCGLLVRPGLGGHHVHVRCPRCGAGVHTRKPNSIARTWALVIAAYILYVPANLLPVMAVTSLGIGAVEEGGEATGVREGGGPGRRTEQTPLGKQPLQAEGVGDRRRGDRDGIGIELLGRDRSQKATEQQDKATEHGLISSWSRSRSRISGSDPDGGSPT